MTHYINKAYAVAAIEKRLHKYEKEYEELARHEIWITAKEIEHKIKGLKVAQMADLYYVTSMVNW